MKKIILLLTFACCLQTNAQQTLNELYATQPVTVVKPYEVDSVDRKNKKFTDDNLMRLLLTIPEQTAFTQMYQADTSGFFLLSPAGDKPFVQLFSFYVEGDGFGEAEVTVTSPNLIDIYIDNNLLGTKGTKEDSLQAARYASAELSPYPRSSRVVIKLLCDSGSVGALKVTLQNVSKKSQRRLVVSHEARRRMVIDDVIVGKRVTDITVSPQGNYALIQFSENYGPTATTSTALYTVKTGRQVEIDRARQKSQLQWMPKTEKLAYAQREGRQYNLVTIDPATLEESVLAKNIPNEPVTFAPDGKSFFYTKKAETANSNDFIFRIQTLSDHTGGLPPVNLLFRYDLTTGLTSQLTFGSHSTSLHDISRDGKMLLFSTADEVITERSFLKSSLFCLHLETMQVDTLWKDEKYASRAGFSPDATKIIITGGPESFGGIGLNIEEGQIANSYDTQAFIMDLATGKIDPVTRDFNPSIRRFDWLTDGSIYFQVEDEDRVAIYSYQLSNRKFTKLPLKEDVIMQFGFSQNTAVMGFTGMSVSNSARAYLFNLKDQKSTLVADPFRENLAQLKLGEVNDFNFTNSAGTEIKGYYFLPPDFDPDRKYPLIVNYYGGTSPTSRGFESRYPLHVYAALGYVVYVLQPSGATGFGQKFSAIHVNTWGIRSSDDIIEGTKKFIAGHPYVDTGKIGCIGASYGGFMTMLLLTKSDLFAAAVSHAGISSISSYWGEGYWGYSYSAAASADSYPWNNRELYVDQSPLFSADKINTPLLLLHGTSDTNVPPGESMQMYTALKILGKPVELVQVVGEDHHILTYDRRLKWNETIFAWFEKWLKDDSGWWESLYK
ncbi:MAG: prolyl oligopeptidase family serine peptidase [Tannerella sp.]|nr:prolyl oligopeptidase family serine peptidase [Tannerella sp.]